MAEVAFQVVHGAAGLKNKGEDQMKPKTGWIQEYTFRQLRISRHTEGVAALQADRADEADEQEDGLTEAAAPKPASATQNFNSYLKNVDDESELRKRASASVGDGDGATASFVEEDGDGSDADPFGDDNKMKSGPARCGGRGAATVMARWESGVPHGPGKAKMLMTKGYEADYDPFAWDMYDEISAVFSYGHIVGEVTIRYQDGGIYKGMVVCKTPLLSGRSPSHVWSHMFAVYVFVSVHRSLRGGRVAVEVWARGVGATRRPLRYSNHAQRHRAGGIVYRQPHRTLQSHRRMPRMATHR